MSSPFSLHLLYLSLVFILIFTTVCLGVVAVSLYIHAWICLCGVGGVVSTHRYNCLSGAGGDASEELSVWGWCLFLYLCVIGQQCSMCLSGVGGVASTL